MNLPINPNRIKKALQALEEAQKELREVLAEAERPRPDLPLPSARVKKYKSKRRVY
jgi:hypothetical protein